MATTGRYYYKTNAQPASTIGETLQSPVTFTPVYQIETFTGSPTLQTGPNPIETVSCTSSPQMYQFTNCQLFDAQPSPVGTPTFSRPVFQNVQDEMTFNQDMEQLKLILTDQISLPPLNGSTGSSMITPPLSPHNDQMIYYQQQPQTQLQTSQPQTQEPVSVKSEYFSIKYRPRKRSIPKQESEHAPSQQTQYIIDTPLFKEIKQEVNSDDHLSAEPHEPVMKRTKKSLRGGRIKALRGAGGASCVKGTILQDSSCIKGSTITSNELDYLQQPIKNSQKRTAHLSAEFRYRTKLNDKICRLRSLVGQKVHLSKSAVLTKSIERIVKLQKLAVRLHESNNRLMTLLSKYVLDPVDRRALEQQANTFQTVLQHQQAQVQHQNTNKLMSIKELTKSLSSNQQKQHLTSSLASPSLSSSSSSSVASSPYSTPPVLSPVSSPTFANPMIFSQPKQQPQLSQQQHQNILHSSEYSSAQNDLFPMDMDRLLEETCLLGDLDAVLFSNTQEPLTPSESGSSISHGRMMSQQSLDEDDVLDEQFDLESLLAQF